jgi:hypothetical protein
MLSQHEAGIISLVSCRPVDVLLVHEGLFESLVLAKVLSRFSDFAF